MTPMGASEREIEVKLPFASAGEALDRLVRLGARTVRPRRFEDNLLLDRDQDPLKDTDRLLRIRVEGDRTLLTFKAPIEGHRRHKVREEIETAVGDPGALRRVLEQLGFTVRWRYQKYRTVFALEDLEIALDETPLGVYVELEGPPGSIDRIAGRLGFPPDRYVTATYRDLHERAASERGVAPGDLLLDRDPSEAS
jgi:adenylate cyclase, class 2